MKKVTSKKGNPVSKPSEQKISDEISFPIVGIGASPGGLEALEQFFGMSIEIVGLLLWAFSIQPSIMLEL